MKIHINGLRSSEPGIVGLFENVWKINVFRGSEYKEPSGTDGSTRLAPYRTSRSISSTLGSDWRQSSLVVKSPSVGWDSSWHRSGQLTNAAVPLHTTWWSLGFNAAAKDGNKSLFKPHGLSDCRRWWRRRRSQTYRPSQSLQTITVTTDHHRLNCSK